MAVLLTNSATKLSKIDYVEKQGHILVGLTHLYEKTVIIILRAHLFIKTVTKYY